MFGKSTSWWALTFVGSLVVNAVCMSAGRIPVIGIILLVPAIITGITALGSGVVLLLIGVRHWFRNAVDGEYDEHGAARYLRNYERTHPDTQGRFMG